MVALILGEWLWGVVWYELRVMSLAVSLLLQPGEFAGADEDAGEHRAVEAAGIGITQGRVVAAEQMQAVGQHVFGGMGEAVVGAAGDDTAEQQVGEEAVPGDLAEADDDADHGQHFNLRREMQGAVPDLLRRRLVAGRRAADDRGDPGVTKLEAVVAGDGAGLRGKAELVQDGVHKVAGAVSGEGAASTVGAVGSRRQAEDEDARAGIAEAGDGARPVGLVHVGAAAGLADANAVFAQARAEFAGDDGFPDLSQAGHTRWAWPIKNFERS